MLSQRQLLRVNQVIADDLADGFMEALGDGTSSRVPLQAVTVEATHLSVTARFGERDGNFNWSERRILTANGELVDSRTGDFGRKIMGAVWDVEAIIELQSGDA